MADFRSESSDFPSAFADPPVDLALGEARLKLAALRIKDQRRNDFIDLVAHQLRGPLDAISNAIHLLDIPGPVSRTRAAAQELIARQASRLTVLLDELLDATQVTAAPLQLNLAHIDVCAVMQCVLASLDAELQCRRLALQLELPAAGVWIWADAVRLEQAFGNLLENAVRDSGADGRIAVIVEARPGGVEVQVRDSGVGIACEGLSEIREIFRHSDPAVALAHTTLGTEMAWVKKIVACHGGVVTAASAGIGRGSEFRVCLPKDSRPASAAP